MNDPEVHYRIAIMDANLIWQRVTEDPTRFWLGLAAIAILLLLVKVSSTGEVVDGRSTHWRRRSR